MKSVAEQLDLSHEGPMKSAVFSSVLLKRFSPVLATALLVAMSQPTLAGSMDTLPGLLSGGGSVQLHFQTEYGGVTIAQVAVTARQNSNKLSTRLNMRTQGLTHTVAPVTMKANAQTLVREPMTLTPIAFDYGYKTRKRSRTVSVNYGGGSVTPKIVSKPGDRARDRLREDAVSANMRKGTIDPLSALIMILRHAQLNTKGKAGGQLSIPVYDGVHRYDLAIAAKGKKGEWINGRSQPVYEYVAQVIPRAGFKPRRAKEWQKRRLVVLVSTDGRFLPLMITVNGGQGVARLMKVCDSKGKCEKV